MSHKVLIVDDVSFVRKTLTEVYTSAGYEVVGEAETAKKAVELYKKTKPDLVTIDLIMPDMNGVELIQRLVREEQKVQILVISGLDEMNLIVDSLQAGARDFIKKPFSAQDVIRISDQILKGQSS